MTTASFFILTSVIVGCVFVDLYVSADLEAEHTRIRRQSGSQNAVTCNVNQFKCRNEDRCISKSNVCNGVKHCLDGSDESYETCGRRSCNGVSQFRCSYGACIQSTDACNGKKDCRDGSDETKQCHKKKCNANEFRCEYGGCISQSLICNGESNCADGSDETPSLCGNNECSGNQFRCNYGACISEKNICDGQRQCVDGSDEAPEICDRPSTACEEDEFRCLNRICIEKDRKCDRRTDCADGSDETKELCNPLYIYRPSNAEFVLNSCGYNSFRCADHGNCVDEKHVCDGRKDCRDGSDETAEICNSAAFKQLRIRMNQSVECDDTQFRCSYGACVDKDALCNGNVDCIDESDESNAACKNWQSNDCRGKKCFRCKYGATIPEDLVCNGNNDCRDGSDEYQTFCQDRQCPENHFKCEIGVCLPITSNLVCNGEKNCFDGLDESAELCKKFQCNSNEFRCSYGACIPSNLICNGVNECQDGSDEKPELCQLRRCESGFFQCNYGACIWDYLKCNGFNDCNDGSDETPEACPTGEMNCTLPSNFADKTYTVTCARGNKLCHTKQKVTKHTQVTFTCSSGYVYQKGRQFTSVCTERGNWVPPISKCLKICDKLPSHLDYTCKEYKNGPVIPCDSVLYEGAVVTPACKPHYRVASFYRERYVTCQSDGTWDPQFFTCTPECGKLPEPSVPKYTRPALVDGVQMITFGSTANVTPWHVTIYRPQSSDRGPICGGTLVSPFAVISAAHCFYNENAKKAYDEGIFEVAVGKYSRDIDQIDRIYTQRTRIRKIFLPDNPKYSGLPHYNADLVILWLRDRIPLDENVLPICLDKENHRRFQPGENAVGRLVGFGRTEHNRNPPFLLAGLLPYLSFSECSRLVGPDFSYDLAVDKFCAGSVKLGDSGAAVGDSGGGLVFREFKNGLYYLRGVVSHRESDSPTSLAAFTDIALYMTWINRIMHEIDSRELGRTK